MRSYDVVVIGGGLLGCFVARNLMRFNLKAVLIEKREDVCTGISRANTAIVYSGCDTFPGTLKTAMCIKASQEFPTLCAELGVRYSQCGSIMVSFGKVGYSSLLKKLKNGGENGVRGMKLLEREEVLCLEPSISANVQAGLHVPDTGTVMPWELCFAAAENAAINGADFFLNTKVAAIDRNADGRAFHVHTNNGVFVSRSIINCAGMAAADIHEMQNDSSVQIVSTAGDYYVLDTKAASKVRHVIFHEPEEKGKGLTLVPTVDGNILLGPTERPGNDFMTELHGLEQLRSLVAEVIPELPMEHVIRSFGAVRPNPELVAEFTGKSINDFCILEGNAGLFISLVGIKTPGLTCANELGIYVSEKIADRLGAGKNPAFIANRLPPVRFSEMSFEERDLHIRRNSPLFGRIVCRCRGVSEGEIIDAISRFPGAVTLDGVKRRTGTGSGRCQGGFCSQRIVEILARELGCSPFDITKDGGSSFVFSE